MNDQTTPGKIISALKPGASVALGKIGTTDGSLEARRLAEGAVHLYWRFTHEGKTTRVPIGTYDSKAPPRSLESTPAGYSVRAAFRRAENMAHEHRANLAAGGAGYVAIQQQRRKVREQAAADAAEAAEHSLKALLTNYCDHQKALGRKSHREALNIFTLHLFTGYPKIAAMPARDVTPEQFADVMRKLHAAGKGRTANKLRSYARSAFERAKQAKSSASIPASFKGFGIRHNPISETVPDTLSNRPDKSPLKADELREYWRLLKAVPGFRGAVLRLHVLTGGQRIEQLVSLHRDQIDDAQITLLDGKGRPGQPPRPHAIPLTKEARKEVGAILATVDGRAKKRPESKGDFAISNDGGLTHIAATTLSAWAAAVADDQIKGFKAKRVRSGVETLLASAGVSSEHRGRLQSHGVSGVQARHYDGHDYMAEKLEALEKLQRLLDAKPSSKVAPIKSKAA